MWLRGEPSRDSALFAMVLASVAVHGIAIAAASGRHLADFAAPPAAAATLAVDAPSTEPEMAKEIDVEPPEASADRPAERAAVPRPIASVRVGTAVSSPARAPAILAVDDPYAGAEDDIVDGDGSGHGDVSAVGIGDGHAPEPVRSLPPQPPEKRTYALSEVDQPPAPLSVGQPPYPRAAQRRESEGTVRLRLLIDERGGVAGVSVLSATGHSSFSTAAVDAARGWRFSPARKQGRAVPVWATQTLSFRLPR